MTIATFQQTLVLPNFPRPDMARALSPNGRAHWAVKRKARVYVVEHVMLYARQAGLQPMRGMVTLWPIFTYPDNRRRDDDNLATGVMKAVRDCLVNGGWLVADDTDHLRQMTPGVSVVKGQRSLELNFGVELQ